MLVFPPGGDYLLSVGDTDISYCRYVNSTIHLTTLVFLIKLPSFLKQIFYIYHFFRKKIFYKKKSLVKCHIQMRLMLLIFKTKKESTTLSEVLNIFRIPVSAVSVFFFVFIPFKFFCRVSVKKTN